MKASLYALALLTVGFASNSYAGEVDVIDAKVTKSGNGLYHIAVTLKHADTGWDHYANRWEVLGEDGSLYATRTLHHPHVNEQPFTRSLSGIKIPNGVQQIIIRGHDSVHGYGGKEHKVEVASDNDK